MTALAVVELDVDALVDEVFQDLVVGEVAFGLGIEPVGGGAGGNLAGRHRPAAALAASGSTTARIRFIASTMFSREFA